jgi:probable HAF family extracellular repeat protein
MTELEVAADYDRLYAWMHPDSKAIVPQSAMEGWYREEFAKRTPTWMTVNDARLVEWTWEVTGKVYPSAAEVSFRQRFVDGEETDGVVRLVRDNFVWRWFFGRDHAFVEEQIARFSGEQPDISQGSSPSLATIPAAGTIERAPYIIFDLGTGNGNWSAAYDINERGDILWTWATSQDPMSDRFFDSHRMLWANGTSTDLSDRGIEFTRSINDGGTVLGGAHVEGASRSHLLYQTDSGTVTPIDPFDGGAVLDINDAGDLLGFIDGTAAIAVQGTVETVPIPQGFTQLQPVAINESGHVAARAAVNPIGDTNQRAALFEDGIVTVLEPAPGALSSSADDLNDLGQLVGSPGIRGSWVIHQNGRAFLHDSGTGRTTDLGTLPGYQNSVATAINNVGQVVGYAWLPENEGESIRRAYLYDYRIGVMTDLNQRIPPGSGWFLTDAFDINDAGQIVGRGLVGGEMHAFLLTPT